MFFYSKIKLKSIIPEGFTDIHSHVLYGIDDGSKSLDDSVSIIKKFQDLGINKIVTTPHVMAGVWPNTKADILLKLDELRKKLIKEGIHNFFVDAAAEYMLDENFIKLLEKKELLTIQGNKILIEMSYISAPSNLFEIIFHIQLLGFIPVLAHPERYNYYHKETSNYNRLLRSGVLFQLNLLSLSRFYGSMVQKTAVYLLENNMYSYVGTDAHNVTHLNYDDIYLSKKHSLSLQEVLKKNCF